MSVEARGDIFAPTALFVRLLRPIRAGEDVGGRLLKQATRQAQRRAGIARILLAGLLLATVAWATSGLREPPPEVARQVEAAYAMLLLFGLIGLGLYVLASRGIATEALPYLTVGTDAALILGDLLYDHLSLDAPGSVTFLFPIVWVVPIALAANAVYYRPKLQVFATALFVVGTLAISLSAGYPAAAERAAAMVRFHLLLGLEPNVVRLVMLLAVGLLLILAARQGRLLLDRAVRETVLRTNLTRFIPSEIAPVLTEDRYERLRRGQRMTLALLFVDIRGSTAMGGHMDPERLARFITAFRRRVSKAAAAHGGVIDKFIGDGALVLFGVPDESPDYAARALACAQAIAALIERWNEKRGFEPAVQIGIGIDCGEVFCGVVGEESRLEFTVLGDAVNTASRLESATKRIGGPILASENVVVAAGEAATGCWIEVSRERLRGLTHDIAIMAPAGNAGEARSAAESRAASYET